MSAISKTTARILREQFGRTKRDAEWLSNSHANGFVPRTARDTRELDLAERMAADEALSSIRRNGGAEE